MNLEGWTYILTFGASLDIYAKDNQRVVIARDTGTVVLRYQIKDVG